MPKAPNTPASAWRVHCSHAPSGSPHCSGCVAPNHRVRPAPLLSEIGVGPDMRRPKVSARDLPMVKVMATWSMPGMTMVPMHQPVP